MTNAVDGTSARNPIDWVDVFMWIITWAFGPAVLLEGLAVLLLAGSPKGYLGIGAGLALTVALPLIRRGERGQPQEGGPGSAPK